MWQNVLPHDVEESFKNSYVRIQMPNIADDFQKLISSSFSEDISLVQFSVVLRHVLTDRDRQTNARQSITFLAEVENRCSLEPHITRSFAYRTG